MAKVQVNLRVEESLKDWVQDIAKEKGTSINDIAVNALEEFVKKYDSRQISGENIPTRDEVIRLQIAAIEDATEDLLALAHIEINNMIQRGGEYRRIRTKDFPNKAVESAETHLRDLGFFTYIFEYGCSEKDNEYRMSYERGDMIIALSPDPIRFLEDLDIDIFS